MSARASRKLPVSNGHEAPRAVAAASKWNYRTWGTLADPIHKSHMSTLVGEFACTMQFAFDRQAELEHRERETIAGKTCMGTAVHETIARALRNPAMVHALLAVRHVSTSRDAIRDVVLEEFNREAGARSVTWYGKSDFADELNDAAEMVYGLFADLHRHVRAVELVEAGFIAKLGELYTEGHTDLVYRPQGAPEGSLAFTDWKTGMQKPHPLQLEHGFEGGFYANALACGIFLPEELLEVWWAAAKQSTANPMNAVAPALPAHEFVQLGAALTKRAAMHVALRALMRMHEAGETLPAGVRRFDQFPEVIRLTHLRDYVPYEKKGTKTIERAEDLAYWSRTLGREVIRGEKIGYEKGQQRGGAWLDVQRRAGDVQRLERMLRKIVGWVRFGRFVEAVSEKCTRCSHRTGCLTDGYQLAPDEMRAANAALAGLDLTGTEDLGID